MDLTNELLLRFIGGQIQIQNKGESCLYCGEVVEVLVENNNLQVRLAWLAKGENFPPYPKKWVKDERIEFNANLNFFSGFDIGSDQLCIYSFITEDAIVLHPPSRSKLNPTEVEGLMLL